MGNNGGAETTTDIRLLGPDEPPPYRVLNERSDEPLLLLCDHASRRIPAALGTLGLDPPALRCHLAWDIGAAAMTERLAESRQATAVLAGYSRLVVDCNRQLLDPQAFLEYGDGIVVAGNRGLVAADREARAREIFWPYHEAIGAQLQRLRAGGRQPAVLSIHSFTPVLNRISRPWEVGILWDKDPRVPEFLIRELRRAGLNVGDNEPYSGRGPQDFTIDYHAEAAGLPHAGVEIRQDLIDDERGVREMAALFEKILGGLAAHLATVAAVKPG
jgi:predicted N-formylglutamate amidohydrolase